MEYISPAENDLFTKALRFLYERRLEQIGFEADVIVTKIRPEEAEALRMPA